MKRERELIIHERIPSVLYEYSITSSKEELLALPRLVLESSGFKEGSISETFECKKWSLKVFAENEGQLDSIKKGFDRLKLPGIKLASKSLKPDQWLTRWKTQWKPLSLTKRIDVVPFWHKGRYKTSKEIIYLDTLMSFGTGMHETTQLIAQLIENNRSQLVSFLDIGTGTGILTLVALKHEAKLVTAMDISPLSVQAAKSNLKVNDLKAKVVLGDIGRLSSKQKYQVVAANLITSDLLKNRRRILSLVNPGGLLMVSGISLDNLKRLTEGFKDLPLTCRKISRGKQWAAILYEKKMS